MIHSRVVLGFGFFLRGCIQSVFFISYPCLIVLFAPFSYVRALSSLLIVRPAQAYESIVWMVSRGIRDEQRSPYLSKFADSTLLITPCSLTRNCSRTQFITQTQNHKLITDKHQHFVSERCSISTPSHIIFIVPLLFVIVIVIIFIIAHPLHAFLPQHCLILFPLLS